MRTSRIHVFLTKSLLVLIAAFAVISAAPGNASRIQDRTYVFRNLAFGNDHYLNYFAVDPETGVMQLSPKASQNESGAFWEVERAWDMHRDGYTTYYIRNRSNSVYNGYYLNVNPANGNLMLTKKPDSFEYGAYWLIRYAKHQHGRAHHMIQSLGETGYDMAFLTADPNSGEIALSRKLSSDGMWTMNSIWLPTERIQ